MAKHTITVRCPTPSSFSVDQVRGMFDLARADEATETFSVELPDRGELIEGPSGEKQRWQIGVIVGPSGSGKSTVARDVYGKHFVESCDWQRGKAVVDHFPDHGMKQVTGMLNAVGFSSPPAWVKPHAVLSGGERFRCDLARALLEADGLVAFDEFTSVVDRQVAKVGSAAVAASIRKGRIAAQFVAVTCHYDILDWLEPDWVLDMASGQLARGRLWRRPKIELEVAPVHRSAWHLFRRHHYMNHEIANLARCFVAFWNGEPVAFSSWIHRMTRTRGMGDMREHRTVVLPDYQGIGIGNRLSELCASIWPGIGGRAFSTTSHPAMIRHRDKSSYWKTIRHSMVIPQTPKAFMGTKRKLSAMEKSLLRQYERTGKGALNSAGRITGGFQYIGSAMEPDRATDLAAARPRPFLLFASGAKLRDALVVSGGSTIAHLARKTGLSTTRVGQLLGEWVELGWAERFPIGRGRTGFAPAGQLASLGVTSDR